MPVLPDAGRPRVIELTEEISLVVADVPAAMYAGHAIEERLRDLEWVTRCGAARPIGSHAPTVVVPFRLFTLFSSDARRDGARAAAPADRGRLASGDRPRRVDPARGATGAATASRPPDAGGRARRAGPRFSARRSPRNGRTRIAHGASNVRSAISSTRVTAVADAFDLRPTQPGTGLLVDAVFLVPVRDVTRVDLIYLRLSALLVAADRVMAPR